MPAAEALSATGTELAGTGVVAAGDTGTAAAGDTDPDGTPEEFFSAGTDPTPEPE